MELLEQILSRENRNLAFKKVVSNKGAAGVDGVRIDEIFDYLKENTGKLLEDIRSRRYKPQPTRRVEIPKENGLTYLSWAYAWAEVKK